MALDFDKFATKGNKFLKDLAKQLGHPEDIPKAGRKLRAVLHATRDQLSMEESLQLLAQLPMFLKAVYVENWKSTRKKKGIKHVEDYLKEIQRYDFRTAKNDFTNEDEVENAAVVVFLCLRRYISLGEMEDIKAVLPKELKFLARNVTMI